MQKNNLIYINMYMEKAKEKVKEIISNPAKFEEAMNKTWEKLDPEKKGYTTYDAVKEQIKKLGLPEKEPTPEQKEPAKNLADPEGTGKITKENFIKSIKCGIEKARAAGKI